MLKSLSSVALTAALAVVAQSAGAADTPNNTPKVISTSTALEMAQAAIASCKASGYNVTVMIMDQDMAPRLVMRSDGAAPRTVEIARRKAYTVIKMGMTSGEFGKSVAAANPSPAPAAPRAPGTMPPGVNGDDNLITFAGGKPIKMGADLLGAMSVSGAPGGDKDEVCVDAGLAKLK